MQFSIFEGIPNFHHALSTREGGVSTAGFSSLNLGFHVGDNPETVRENRRLFAQSAGFDLANLVAAQQVHGVHTRIVSHADAGSGALDWQSAIPNSDALATREPNLPLLILVADCAPILLIDPTNRAFAVVHAGWRGALAGIAGLAVAKMVHEFGTRPNDLLAAIGPCLSLPNLEVGEEVAAQVEAVNPRAVTRAPFPKPHLDLRALISDDLTSAGVEPDYLEISPFCPKERTDLFFSHRAQNGHAGRVGIVAWWT